MCFFFSFLPATFWLVIGYFVLFSSTKADGRVQTFGQILAIWTFIIAALLPIVALYVTLAGLCPMEAMMEAMQSKSVSVKLRGEDRCWRSAEDLTNVEGNDEAVLWYRREPGLRRNGEVYGASRPRE